MEKILEYCEVGLATCPLCVAALEGIDRIRHPTWCFYMPLFRNVEPAPRLTRWTVAGSSPTVEERGCKYAATRD